MMAAIYESLLDAAVTSAVGVLAHLSMDELKAIVDDDAKQDDLIKDLPQLQNLVKEKELLITQNRSLAEFNLAQEPGLKEAKKRLLETHKQACELKSDLDKLKATIVGQTEQRSLDTSLALLQAAAAETEEESEKIAEDFLSGAIPLEVFLEKFKLKRSLAHMRKIKAERMAEAELETRQRISGTSVVMETAFVAWQTSGVPNNAMLRY